MKPILLLALLSLFISQVQAQSLKKVPIKTATNTTGCSVYSFCDLTFSVTPSPDSSEVYLGECIKDSLVYGVVFVKLAKEAIATDFDVAIDLTISYLDFLKSNLTITSAVGYGKGHTLRNNENIRGVVDYWEDQEKNNWKIKAWTDKTFICVLYAYSNKELPEQKIDAFLNGLTVPGM